MEYFKLHKYVQIICIKNSYLKMIIIIIIICYNHLLVKKNQQTLSVSNNPTGIDMSYKQTSNWLIQGG